MEARRPSSSRAQAPAVPRRPGTSASGRRRAFDRHLGPCFLDGVPAAPGVYRVFDESGELIYVGKAQDLRRRLGQYRNAGRRRRRAKTRAIVRAARRIEIETCASHLDACLLEARLIQEHRPRFNVAGAFHFLYPFLGLEDRDGDLCLSYSTSPDAFPRHELHGAYRSRLVTREAYWALVDLLSFLVRCERKASEPRRRYSFVRVFRRLGAAWKVRISAFLRGEGRELLRELSFALLAKAAARRSAAEVEAELAVLGRFWSEEIEPLARARAATGCAAWPVPQVERDPLFLRAKFGPEKRVA